MNKNDVLFLFAVCLAFIAGAMASQTFDIINPDAMYKAMNGESNNYYGIEYGCAWLSVQDSLCSESPDEHWSVNDREITRDVLNTLHDRYSSGTWETTQKHLDWLEDYRVTHHHFTVDSFNNIKLGAENEIN